MNLRRALVRYLRRHKRRTTPSLGPAWAAGLVDGSGTITTTRVSRPTRTGAHRVRLTVVSHAPDTLVHLRSIIGERCELRRCKPTKGNGRSRYALDYHGRDAQRALTNIREFLTVKRQAAEFAIACACAPKPGRLAFPEYLGRLGREINRWFCRLGLLRS
jgi:hypothetical protein